MCEIKFANSISSPRVLLIKTISYGGINYYCVPVVRLCPKMYGKHLDLYYNI